MEYILLIHNNTDTQPTQKEWQQFFSLANKSDLFRGGSALGKRIQLGNKDLENITKSVVGYMLFESSNIDAIKTLLREHPVYKKGGTLELCECPRT